MRTDGVHRQESAGTGSVVLKVVPATGTYCPRGGKREAHENWSMDGRCRGKRGESRDKYQPIRFSLRLEDERADAGRDGSIYLARPNSQARAFSLFS